MSEQNNKEADEVVLYEVRDAVALVTMNRPEYHNAQNSRMTYALDAAFARACADDRVKVIVLRGPASTSPPGTTSAPQGVTSTRASSA